MYLPDRRWLLGALGLSLVAPVALIWPQGGALLLVGDLLWILAFVLDAWRLGGGRSDPARIDIRREPPPAFSVGRPLPVLYIWTNPGLRPLELRIREFFPPALHPVGGAERQLTLAPGGRCREEVILSPVRRGRGEGGELWLRARGPWGLAWRQMRRELPWEAVVYPTLAGVSLRALPSAARRRREAGLRNVRQIGEGRMFESLREWVPGDDTRTIDWKATARRGKVMARQYEDERRQQVMLLVDAGRMLTAEVDGKPRLEAVVEAVLQLAWSVVEHDDNLGLMVFADQVLQFIPPARGRRALRAVLDGLASVEGKLVEPDYPAAFANLALRSRKRALTVLFTDVIDRTASEALVAQLGTLRPRHLPLAVTLRDPSLERLATARPGTVAAAFERAAAEELLLAREAALAEMRRRGVMVLDVSPAGAAAAVVEQYHQLKRRGVL